MLRRNLFFRPYQMGATSMVYPYKIFSKSLPPPPSWTKQDFSSSDQCSIASSFLQWKESGTENKILTMLLSSLQTTLRSVHKRKVTWPKEEELFDHHSINDYLRALLQPVADLFNQLHAPDALKTPMETVRVDLGEHIYGITFKAEDFKSWNTYVPIIISLSDDIFNPNGSVSSRVSYSLSKALEYESPVSSIIVTNFKDIAVFFPPTRAMPRRPQPSFERMSSTEPFLALRVLSAACLHHALPVGIFIDLPHPDPGLDADDEGLIHPAGPPQNPNQPLLPDEQVFATHHRQSDFDIATLVRDRTRALQFFRWRERVQQQYSKLVAHPNDRLTAMTNKLEELLPNIHPIYPYDASEIPTDTTTHLATIQRESPLVNAGIIDSFMRSRIFTLEIENVLSAGSPRSICTTYRCRITSIDGEPVSSPPLCLKLFDDRFQQLPNPYEDREVLEEFDELLPSLFRRVITAEMYAANEAFTYDKLSPAQGSVIPWFYGTHEFTLPDGTVLFGLLMEYIEGWALDSKFAQELSPSRQETMLQSCRHAVRVLDVADVSQRDWHRGQILLYTNPTTKRDHVVLIDFASTTQTWRPDDLNLVCNYVDCFTVLLNESAFDRQLVWKYFGEPDDWDPVFAIIPITPGRFEGKVVKARDMFPYIIPR